MDFLFKERTSSACTKMERVDKPFSFLYSYMRIYQYAQLDSNTLSKVSIDDNSQFSSISDAQKSIIFISRSNYKFGPHISFWNDAENYLDYSYSPF